MSVLDGKRHSERLAIDGEVTGGPPAFKARFNPLPATSESFEISQTGGRSFREHPVDDVKTRHDLVWRHVVGVTDHRQLVALLDTVTAVHPAASHAGAPRDDVLKRV